MDTDYCELLSPHIYTHACHILKNIDEHIQTYARMHMHSYAQKYTRMRTKLHVCVYTHTHTRSHTHVNIRVQPHSHRHIHLFLLIHVYMPQNILTINRSIIYFYTRTNK